MTRFTLVNLAPLAPIRLWATYEITIRNYSTESTARTMGFFRRRRFLCRDGLEVHDSGVLSDGRKRGKLIRQKIRQMSQRSRRALRKLSSRYGKFEKCRESSL